MYLPPIPLTKPGEYRAIGNREGARRSMQNIDGLAPSYAPWPRTMASVCLPPSAAALNPA